MRGKAVRRHTEGGAGYEGTIGYAAFKPNRSQVIEKKRFARKIKESIMWTKKLEAGLYGSPLNIGLQAHDYLRTSPVGPERVTPE